MFGSAALEFAIGLSFVYLILSLAVTALQEGIASVFRRRARTLASGVHNLLRDDSLVDSFYAHPLVKSLHSGNRKPSYIPSRVFALALLDVITPQGQVPTAANVKTAVDQSPDGIRRALAVIYADAGGDFDKFKQNIEVWFNHGMERVGGWYKRYTQAILIAIAIPLTIAVNADSLVMSRAIWRDPTLRATLVAEAEKVHASPPVQLQLLRETSPGDFVPPAPPAAPPEDSIGSTVANAEQLIKQLTVLQLPLGWEQEPPNQAWTSAIVRHGAGWALTVLAISLGSPFWFDLLNKFMAIRGAGKAPEEKQKSPKEEQPPLGPGESPAEARRDPGKQ